MPNVSFTSWYISILPLPDTLFLPRALLLQAKRGTLLIFFPFLGGVAGSVFPPVSFALHLSSCSLLISFTSLSSHFVYLLWKSARKHKSRSSVYLMAPPTSPLMKLDPACLPGLPVASRCFHLKYSIENRAPHDSVCVNVNYIVSALLWVQQK